MDLQEIKLLLLLYREGELPPHRAGELADALSALPDKDLGKLLPAEEYGEPGRFSLPENEVDAALCRFRAGIAQEGGARVIHWRAIYAYAAILIILITGSLYFYNSRRPGQQKPVMAMQYKTIRVRDGERSNIVLPDGTRVTLNGGSTIQVPEDWNGKERSISLTEGEVFLDVAKDPARPFQVKTPNWQIQVLGTSFSIRDYADELHASVAVSTGKIAVQRISLPTGNPQNNAPLSNTETSILIAGNRSELDRSAPGFSVNTIDTATISAWMRGELIFQNTSLQHICHVLKHRYAVEFHAADERIWKKTFVATFRNTSLESILKQLELMGNIHYKAQGRRITFI